jgi:hypothetical protein
MICHSLDHALAKTTQKSSHHPKASFFLFESCKFLWHLTTTLPIVATKNKKNFNKHTYPKKLSSCFFSSQPHVCLVHPSPMVAMLLPPNLLLTGNDFTLPFPNPSYLLQTKAQKKETIIGPFRVQ